MQKILYLFAVTLLLGFLNPLHGQTILPSDPTTVNPTCPGDSNGVIDIVLQNDSSNYLFDWTGGNAIEGFTAGLKKQTGLASGTYSIFILDLTSFEDTTITVNLTAPNPILVSAGADIRSCVGLRTRLNGTASSSGTFVWSYRDEGGINRTLIGASVAIPGTGIGSLAVNTSTTVHLRVTSAGGCQAIDSLVVSVNPVPIADFAFDKAGICIGQRAMVSFTGTASSEAVYNWVIVGSGGFFTANSSFTINGPGPHEVQFDQAGTGTPPLRSVLLRVTEPTNNGSGSCQSNRSKTIVVEPIPTLSINGLPPKACIYSPAITLVGSPIGGQFKGTGVTGTQFLPGVAGVGLHTIYYVFSTSAGCKDSVAATIKIFNRPSVSISNLDSAYCQNTEAFSLITIPTSATTSGSGVLGKIFNPSLSSIGFNVIQTNFTDTNGCSNTINYTVHIKPVPTLQLSADSLTLCANQIANATFSSNFPSSLFSFTPINVVGVSGQSSGNGPVLNQRLSGNGQLQYVVTASLDGCSAANDTLLVRVSQRPVITGLPDSVSICSGITLTQALNSNLAGSQITSYVDSISAFILGSLNATGDTLRQTLSNAAASAQIVRYGIYASLNGCHGDTSYLVIMVFPNPQVQLVSADTLICSGDSIRLAVTSSVSGSSFTFTYQPGIGTILGLTNATGNVLHQQGVNNDTTRATGQFTIIASANGCIGNPKTVQVAVSPRLFIGSLVPDSITVCGETPIRISLNTTPSQGQVEYTYSPVSGNITGLSSGVGNLINQTASGSGTGIYTLMPTLDGCRGISKTVIVQVNPKPIVFVAADSVSICSGSSLNELATVSPSTANISWSALPNVNIQGANGSPTAQLTDTLINSTLTRQKQFYQVIASSLGCLAEPVGFTANVLPSLIAQISPLNQTICNGDTAKITIASNQGNTTTASYTVISTFNVVGAASGSGTSIRQALTTSDSASGNVVYQIIVSNNGCLSDTVLATVSIKQIPKAQIGSLPTSICQYDTLTAVATALTDSTTLTWEFANTSNWQILSNANGVLEAIALQAGRNPLQVVATRNGCQSTISSTPIEVRPAPTSATITIAGPTQFCQGDSTTLQVPSLIPHPWYFNSNTISAPIGTQAKLVAKNTGLYTVRAVGTNGCRSIADSVIIIVNPLPTQPLITGASRFCAGDSTTLLTSDTTNTLQWFRNGNAISNTISSSLVVNTPGAYTVSATNSSGCENTSSIFTISQDSISATAAVRQTNCIREASVSIIVVGTTNPIGILWSTPIGIQATDSISPAPAGFYFARVTDSLTGCIARTDTVEVVLFTQLALSIQQSNPTNCNINDGKIKALTNTAGSIITIQSTAGVIGADSAKNLPPGAYLVIARNGLCVDSANVLLANPANLGIEVARTVPQPCRNIDGTAKVTIPGVRADSILFKNVSGGIIPSFGDSISGLSPGLYRTIVYRSGCIDSTEFSIAVPDNFRVLAQAGSTLCGDSTGTISLQLIGSSQPDSVFVIKGTSHVYRGLNTQIANLSAGMYKVMVYEGNCVDSTSVAITDSLPFTASATNTTTCLSTDGTLTVSGIPATGTSVSWFNVTSARNLAGTGFALLNNPVGTYRAIVSRGGCIDSASLTIARPAGCDPACNLRLVASSSPVSCFGSADGEALGLTLNAGTRKVEYRLGNANRWERVDSLYKRFTSLTAGAYSISVRDSIDTLCVAQTSFNIGTRITLVTTLNLRNADCGSDSGQVQFTIAGGLTPYQFSTDSGRTFQSMAGTSANQNLDIGNYFFQVRDASPCLSPAHPFQIGGSPRLRIHIEAINPICNGSATGGFRVLSIVGDTAAEYKIGNAPYARLTSGAIFTGLSAGSSTILFRSITGACPTDTTITLMQPAPIVATTQIVNAADCGQNNASFKIVLLSGGAGRYTFRLLAANNSVVYQGLLPVDSTFSNLNGGIYSLAVIDTLGCGDSAQVIIPENRVAFGGSMVVTKQTACASDTITYKLLANSASIQRQWFVNGLPFAGATSDSFAIRASLVDSISVLITSTSACLSGLPVVIKGLKPTILAAGQPLITNLISNGTISCRGSQIRLTASTSPALAGTQFQFLANGQVIRQSTDSSITINLDSVLRMQVVASVSGYGCLAVNVDSSNLVNLTPFDSINVISSAQLINGSDTLACANRNVGIRLQTNLSALPGVEYRWLINGQVTTGATDSLIVSGTDTTLNVAAIITGPASQTCLRINPDTTTAIRIRFRSASDPLCLPCQLVAQVDTIINNACTGQFNGEIRFAITGGTGNYEISVLGYRPYFYYASNRVSSLPSGIYTFIIRDTLNPTCTDTIRNIAVNTRYNLNATIQTVRPTQCSGTPNGEIRITQIAGGFGPYLTKIRNTDTLTNQLVYANLRSGIYSLTLVDDSTGCTFISPVQIDTNLPLKAFASTLRVPACYRDQELVFQIDSIKNGNPAYQISALNADTGYRAINFAQAVSNISSAPIRTFFVKDGNGCKTAITFNLPVRDSLQVSVNIASRSECFSPTGKLRFTSAEGGTGSIKLLITNLNRQVTDTLLVLPADSMLNNLEAGAYLITIQDSLGCYKSVSITVPGNSPRASQLVIKNACPGQSNGSIQLSGLTGGTKPFDFELTRADGFQRIQRDSLFGSLSTGIYTITISDSSQPQCRSVYTREVKFIDSLKINVVAFKPSSCSNYDGEVRFTIIGGLAQYQYSIDSTVNTYTPFRTLIADTVAINGLTARSIGQLHTIKVIDASPNGGCTAQLSFQMPGNTPLTYEYELKNVNCFGDSTGQLQLFNLQGTGPLIVEAYRTGTGELIASDSIRMAYFNNDQFNASGLPAGMYNMQVRQYGACSGSQIFNGEIIQNTPIVLYARNTYGSAPEYPEGELELDSARGGVGQLNYSFNNGPLENFTDGIWKKDLSPGTYPVLLQDSLGCQVSYSLQVYRDSVFSIPNVFTPDGDGRNDTWVIKNLPADAVLTIANRWGRTIFESKPYRNDFSAQDVPQGTYLYTLQMPDGTKRSGWLDIIK